MTQPSDSPGPSKETVLPKAGSDTNVYLAVDLGASSGRVIGAQVVAGKLELTEVHRFANEPVHIQDSYQWDVHGLWREILTGLRMAGQQFTGIASVGVDTWGVDYVLLNRQDQFAGPVRHYRDERKNGIMERVFQTCPRDEIFAATGLQFMEINSLFQLCSAVECGDPALEIAESFLMMGDFFHWLLTGVKSLEATNASTTQMLDPRDQTWSVGLMQRCNIPQKLFCEVTVPGTKLGMIQPSVVAETGLADVPVYVPATHDTGSAVVAVPAGEFAPQRPDWCYISSGTWSLMGCELAEPKINEMCAEMNFTNEGGVYGSTRLLQNIGGLWLFQQLRRSMQRRAVERDWAEMVSMAESAQPFGILLDPDDSAFAAPTDMLDAMKEFAERTGQAAVDDEAVWYRASLEGLAIRYRVCLADLEKLVGGRIDTIHVVGGGANNEMLCQMTADACNRTVIAGPVEATAIGNVIMQMIGVGEIESVDAGRRLVQESFDVKTYRPQSPANWDTPSAKWCELTGR
ncbi:rhamnulokinase [Stieleria varia]|uniref:Rhamnulokinase n=1 Tax=Stieleria varia TaxID=2528005 RepID=A0A5C6ATE0_9BACT|nr:rhamnulokinase family protein [Stieleria varia]TWU02681.1 Rhamnulokinase [Stieleria varia]